MKLTRRVFPHRENMDGFYIAKLMKTKDGIRKEYEEPEALPIKKKKKKITKDFKKNEDEKVVKKDEDNKGIKQKLSSMSLEEKKAKILLIKKKTTR